MHWAPGTTQEFQVSEGYVVSKSLLDIRSGMEGYSVQCFWDSERQDVRKKQFQKGIFYSVSLPWKWCKEGLSALQNN